MDEADDFVETMAWLSYLEECDERSRNFEGLKKRWHARRGLIGKPNPRKEVLVTRARSGTLTHVSDTDLVPYLSRKFEEKPKGRMMLVSQQYGHVVPRNMKSNRRFGVQGPIQQPRKQN